MPLGWPCALFGDPHDVGHAFLDQNVSRRRCVHLKTGMPVGSIGGAYRMLVAFSILINLRLRCAPGWLCHHHPIGCTPFGCLRLLSACTFARRRGIHKTGFVLGLAVAAHKHRSSPWPCGLSRVGHRCSPGCFRNPNRPRPPRQLDPRQPTHHASAHRARVVFFGFVCHPEKHPQQACRGGRRRPGHRHLGPLGWALRPTPRSH